MTSQLRSRSSTPATRRALWSLVIAFAIWGSVVAIGATGYFTDVGLFDARRSLIVIGCTVVFMAFWCWVFLRPPGPREAAATRGTNWSSLASLISIGVGFLGWGIAAVSEGQTALVASLISLGGMGLSGLLAIIGLSDPRPRRLKLLGLASLLLLLLAILALVAGMFTRG